MLKALLVVVMLTAVAMSISEAHGLSEDQYAITGQILYHDGSPAVALDELCIWARENETTSGCRQTTTSDSEGRFTFNMAAGTYSLMVRFQEKFAFWHASTGSVTFDFAQKTWFSVPEELPLNLQITLPNLRIINQPDTALGTIAGRIDGTNGNAAQFHLYEDWNDYPSEARGPFYSNRQGDFAFDLPAGTWHLTVRVPGLTWAALHYASSGSGNLTTAPQLSTPISLQPNTEQQLHLTYPTITTLTINFSRSDGLIHSHYPNASPVEAPLDAPLHTVDFSVLPAHGTWREPCGRRGDGCAYFHYAAPLSQGNVQLTLLPGPVYLRIDYLGDRWWYAAHVPGRLTRNPAVRTFLHPHSLKTSEPLALSIPTPRTYTVKQSFRPGINLIGWHGGAIPVRDFLRASPGVVGLLPLTLEGAVDFSAKSSWGDAASSSLLRHGQVVLAYFAGHEETTYNYTTTEPPDHSLLKAGITYVAWAGPDKTLVKSITKGLGSSLVSLQVVPGHVSEEPDATQIHVSRGQLLRLEMSADVVWLANPAVAPEITAVGTEAKQSLPIVMRHLMQARELFWEKFGVVAAVNVEFAADWDEWVEATGWRPSGESRESYIGFYSQNHIFMGEITATWRDVDTIVHEYFHAIQSRLNTRRIPVPSWLVEGSAVHMSQEFYNRTYSYRPEGSGFLWWVPEGVSNDVRDALPNSIYNAGAVAVKWLAANAGGEEAIVEFFRLLAHSETWTDAFFLAFGITIDQFYERFQAAFDDGFA